jgi:hypothetical protein
VEGYVVETGLKFVMSVDYNKFKDIFIQRKNRRQQRKAQKENEKEAKQSEKATTASGNVPQENPPFVTYEKVIIADDRKNIAATVKDSTDGN